MDPTTTERLSQINQRILNVENERRERQQTLHAFLEHVPAVFPELVEQRIQQLFNQIQTLKEEGMTLSRDRENLIVRMAFRCCIHKWMALRHTEGMGDSSSWNSRHYGETNSSQYPSGMWHRAYPENTCPATARENASSIPSWHTRRKRAAKPDRNPWKTKTVATVATRTR
uniref:Uncharacterized protein n=1 Tax=Solanum tuberosum TaxID=4113 RepID=M1BIJ2_SOLTU